LVNLLEDTLLCARSSLFHRANALNVRLEKQWYLQLSCWKRYTFRTGYGRVYHTEAALREFRNGSTNILVATDVASRGLDVTGVSHVVNLDLPKAMEDYVHCIGRTCRAGTSGRATYFSTDRDMFLVAHIRKATADAEARNTMAFATGKAARRKEREQATPFREGRLAPTGTGVIGATTIHVEDKYKYMLAYTNLK